MTRWIIWGIIMFLNNGFSTLVSRARNTPDKRYHGICAALNHATWFVTSVMLIWVAVDIKTLDLPALYAGLYYTACSTAGSVIMHYVSINYLEKGMRRVGAYEDGHGRNRQES
jgi:Na+-driven multidrug efflux pump